MHLITSTVGRKILMAVTGLMLVGFISVHLLGNLSIFAGPEAINIYAEKLHSLGPLVWVFRLVMLGLFAVHIGFGIQLSLENRKANPESYAIKANQKATFSSETMLYTGLFLLAFLVYHLLHFTAQVVHTDFAASNLPLDAAMRLDVFSMVVGSFQTPFISGFYILAMIALAFHLAHGLSSWVQTLGWNNGESQDWVIRIGKGVAVVFGLAYIAIPFLILVRFVK